MLEETQSGLFTPFTQADNSTTRRFGGTGLGLAISKQLIGLLGGEIAVKSELGKGSTFHFWVPYKILQSPTLTSNGEGDTLDDKDLVSCTGARILLAEDNTVSLLVASKALSRAGYHVIEARTGKEALEIWERGEFDLILMDCQMPEMDGYEASRQIRLRENGSRRIPIIAMTATAMAGDREKCFDAGMDEFVAKPVPLKELTAVVNRVLWNSRRGPQQASSTVPPVCTASAIDRALSAADHGSVCR
jgi:CheY-like chemotaxis protein